MLKLRTTAGVFLLALFAGACVGSLPKCPNYDQACYKTDVKSDHVGRVDGPMNGSSTNGEPPGGEPPGGTSPNKNNGFGNGNQDAPGKSANHNRAENDRDGRADPSHGANRGG